MPPSSDLIASEATKSDLFQARKGGVVIGYDARHNSQRWARLTAGVFLREGFKVSLFSTITPTPWVPFAVKQTGAAVGIMVTASHNPKEDNGYKVYWNNGAQVRGKNSFAAGITPTAVDLSF